MRVIRINECKDCPFCIYDYIRMKRENVCRLSGSIIDCAREINSDCPLEKVEE